MEVPAQPPDNPGSFRHQVFSVVDEQPDCAFGAIEPGNGQPRFALCRTSNRESIDGIRLPVGARRIPVMSHQLGWHTHDPFASRE